ncbi:MAG: response regulator [Geobacteraceae bacterium]|nr:response regulator [Geobacteraceae bacterium]
MGSISILLADDSITIQKVVGIIFGSDDYTLTVVDNGKAAVQKAQELQPDVLLIDALMPGMNGYEVCEAIRKDAALAAKPVLLLTGSFEPFDEDKARQCGADDHIVKPFESQQIVAKVQELYQLGRNRAGSVTAPAPEVVPAVTVPELEPASESTISFEPIPEPMVAFEAPLAEPAPVRSADDPWGAFTQPPATVAAVEETFISPPEPSQPLAAEVTSTAPAVQPQDDNIGSSWIPDGEQTFEFREEETAPAPFTVTEEAAAPEAAPALSPAAFEPLSVPEPVAEQVAEPPVLAAVPEIAPELPATVPAAGAIALTDEQLKAALMAASKETIERIVWEVVPDLAEAMIKEAIKRITEAK